MAQQGRPLNSGGGLPPPSSRPESYAGSTAHSQVYPAQHAVGGAGVASSSHSGSGGSGSGSRSTSTRHRSHNSETIAPGIVQGNASGPGGSASVPGDTRDVAVGGIGSEYGPYSHIRATSVPVNNGRNNQQLGNTAQAHGLVRPPPLGHKSVASYGSNGSATSSTSSSNGLLAPLPAGKEKSSASSVAGSTTGYSLSYGGAGQRTYRSQQTAGSASTPSNMEKGSAAGSGAGAAAAAAAPSPLLWTSKDTEVDDYLHNPDPKGKKDRTCTGFGSRGVLNVLALFILVVGLLVLFAGYPLISHFVTKSPGNLGGFGLGGTNGTGQVAQIPGLRNLIDPDTPTGSRTWTSPNTANKYDLVFSDEFNLPGRTFWPGDDPFWEAVDLWYGGTGDYEWYSPEAINTTADGALTILMSQQETHNLNFQSGMLQSWNKFCFTGGYIEFSAMLPGRQDTRGFWPGLWTMGNLGRPGYLGSTDGMWPYSYASCDWGTLINQTSPDGTQPSASLNANGPYSAQYGGSLSYLPGQRTSACTCPGEDHPGPNVRVSRSAPEIDALEAQNTVSGTMRRAEPVTT